MSVPRMESLKQLLDRTIEDGETQQGNEKARFDLYLEVARHAGTQPKLAKSSVGQLLEQATDEATPLGEGRQYGEGSWVLRHAFNKILNDRFMENINSESDDDSSDDATSGGSSIGYWQDESVRNTSDSEKAQCISEIHTILQSIVKPTTHTRYLRQTGDCFPGTSVVDVLVKYGLAVHRKMATEYGALLLRGSFLISVSHSSERSFVGGTHLYRFGKNHELRSTLDRLQKSGPHMLGSDESILLMALRTALDIPITEHHDEIIPKAGVSERGLHLARLAEDVQKTVAIEDRKYHFKTYQQCFVGSEAVSALVKAEIAGSRQDAVDLLEQLCNVGFIHHVTYDHRIKDKYLFYRFASPKDIKMALDARELLSESAGQDPLVRKALDCRYKQFTRLEVNDILDIFYGGSPDKHGEECWDKVDLQTWRNNMKRWGFGRRSDQDDDMVNRLSPLLVDIDPDDWDMDKLGDEWSSPWGILAQIALFDQIPRSAFRGTYDAFKWDQLAIRATKVAIDRGYFHTAYKSTLNQFVVLLPLEHSESWEDQKLGVTLLLRMLSTVAIQDEGLGDYEIVKRLEFSKRLTTAFLEHAQVIAKFKHYPHRNKALGRNTTLEERIWLASDLVPRWAKSQQQQQQDIEEGEGSRKGNHNKKNIINLPLIPLKRFTRG